MISYSLYQIPDCWVADLIVSLSSMVIVATLCCIFVVFFIIHDYHGLCEEGVLTNSWSFEIGSKDGWRFERSEHSTGCNRFEHWIGCKSVQNDGLDVIRPNDGFASVVHLFETSAQVSPQRIHYSQHTTDSSTPHRTSKLSTNGAFKQSLRTEPPPPSPPPSSNGAF
jgi:hypothetical protein